MLIWLHRILGTTALLFWFLIGIYFGVSGLVYGEEKKDLNAVVTLNSETTDSGKIKKEIIDDGDVEVIQKYIYDGIIFTDRGLVDEYIKAKQLNSMFTWLADFPELIILVLTSCALGAFGGVIRIVRQITFEGKKIEDTKYITIPFLGLLLGMVVLGISYLLPTILTVNDDIQISETSLVFFSLFAGLFSQSFLTWLDSKFQAYLTQNNDA